MITAKAYAAMSAESPLVPYQFNRRELRPDDVQVEILYCGVCHSDLHQARNEWGGSIYPMVPGHEIVGKVVAVGSAVTKYKSGDTVGVGVITDSCGNCKPCEADYEQYCVEGATGTYNTLERDGVSVAQGGYSSQIVVKEKFVLSVSAQLDLKAVAPLLCAGITTYSPLRYAGVTKGMKVGVIGLGGLGHMGVKFAVSFGAEVSVLSTSPGKEADAKRLGATNFILTTDKKQMKEYAAYFDVILDAVSANHDFTVYLNLLGLNGKLLVVGLPAEAPKVSPFSLITNRRSITGSMIGGMKETQEMLDYCAEKNIVADVELIRMDAINEGYERMLKGDVKYRFVLDLKTL
ncbi:MAG: NAD(P)-dependent alcohol dehydrogenase [Lacibacter sp.]